MPPDTASATTSSRTRRDDGNECLGHFIFPQCIFQVETFSRSERASNAHRHGNVVPPVKERDETPRGTVLTFWSEQKEAPQVLGAYEALFRRSVQPSGRYLRPETTEEISTLISLLSSILPENS